MATVLNGHVTRQNVYDACRNAHYNAIHFAGHSTPEVVQLSAGDTLDADSVAQLARMAHAELLIFNSCDSARLASYAVRHGVDYAIASTIKLDDTAAWSFAVAFFRALANGAWRDILGAFLRADGGDGDYALSIAPALYMDSAARLEEMLAKRRDTVALNVRTLVLISTLTMMGLFILALLLLGLAGVWTR
jgi:hypothetical protein